MLPPKTCNTLEEAVKGTDMFLGLSTADVFTAEMLRTMAANPIVFALANPDPEIAYDTAMETREDIVMATAAPTILTRLTTYWAFPIFSEGALDVRSTAINEEMKQAAVLALAELTKEPVPDMVLKRMVTIPSRLVENI